MDSETSLYSPLKRLCFFENQIRRELIRHSSLKIIEFGCGTGEGLLIPLAARFPDVQFAGIDSHSPSIEHARARSGGQKNLSFYLGDVGRMPAEITSEKWDIAITSEILEHCDDPFGLLKSASSLLERNGLLLITVPNGYGPFEWEKLLWGLFGLEKVMARARLHRHGPAVHENPTTLNDANRHVCFFSWREIKDLITAAGFEMEIRENREFFCGPFSDLCLSALNRLRLGGPLIAFSQTSARFLPPVLVSDWMIAARKLRDPRETQEIVPPRHFLKKWWWDLKRKYP